MINVFEISKSTGGVGSYTRRLVKGLNKDKFNITVACLSTGSEKMAEELGLIPGVTALSLSMAEYHIAPLSDLKVFVKLFLLIRRIPIDIIHAHTSKPGFLVRLAALGTGIPVIYRPANFSFDDSVPKRRAYFYAFVERLAARYLTTLIITVSNGERELARRYNVGHDSQFVTISTGLDLSQFDVIVDVAAERKSLGIPEHTFLVGTVSRIIQDKGPFDFIDAAVRIHRQNPNVHFLWVGDGPLEEQVKRKIGILGLQDMFHFVGLRNDVPKLLKLMDCFVLASHSEALSIAMLEAMASGLPVIVTSVPGSQEAIQPGETGFIVPIGGIQEMADSVMNLILNPDLGKIVGAAAKKRISSNFSLDLMIRRTEELYESLLKDRYSRRE